MKKTVLTADYFRGAVSLAISEEGIKPWRIPYQDYELFAPDGIGGKAEICAGVRLCVRSNAKQIRLTFAGITEDARIDCLADGVLLASNALQAGDTETVFAGMGDGRKDVEIYLPQNIGMTLSGLWTEQEAEVEPLLPTWQQVQFRWIAYGSSITQCAGASSPSRTWPAIAARECGLDLTCLGFSGNCHLEPMVARMIRDLPTDFISLGVGINVYGANSLGPRTFRPALIGMLETIRERHPYTPLLVNSPLYAVHRETDPNLLGYTLPAMREEVELTVEMLKQRGDQHIYYLNGLELLGPDDEAHLPDQLHPDAAGYELIASRFVSKVLLPMRERAICRLGTVISRAGNKVQISKS
ncbi:GDSL family lipase [Paenibacillaceae bacterium]|nr:GDSL family lipase [Paenibacillaceae bacterium]